ncbi:MAG: ParB/RepB/Spo0J family partition protein [Bacteroidetes bacterium]|nr:ParB/RepB/Spo0J family partition protein [Bacteroidota bacterium]
MHHTITYLPIGQIVPNPKNPRKTIREEELKELAESIKSVGVLQPIIVRPDGDYYELVCGERRFKASTLASQTDIPAIIRNLTDDETMDLMITENLQRKDVSPIEESDAFLNLVQYRGYDVKALSARFGKSESYIRHRMKLADLIDGFRDLLAKDIITIGHALEICKVSAEYQKDLLEDEFGNTETPYWDCPTVANLRQTITRQYMGDLAEVKFDTSDPDLLPSMGACTTCPFNTASDTLLFPDAGTGRCLKKECLDQKEAIHLEKRIKYLVENEPEVLLLHGYTYNEEKKKKVKELQAAGYPVIQDSDWIKIHPPMPPDPEDFDLTGEEDRERFEWEKREYESNLAEYHEDIKSPGARRFLDVFDAEEGFCRPSLAKKKAATAPATNSTDPTFARKESIRQEIVSLEDQFIRNGELQDQKVFEAVEEALKSSDYKYDQNLIFSSAERDALALIMLKDVAGGYMNDGLTEEIFGAKERYISNHRYYEVIGSLTEAQRAKITRAFILHHLVENHSGPDVSGSKSETKMLFQLVESTIPDLGYSDLRKAVEDKYRKRNQTISEKLATLRDELKALEEKPAGKGKKKVVAA